MSDSSIRPICMWNTSEHTWAQNGSIYNYSQLQPINRSWWGSQPKTIFTRRRQHGVNRICSQFWYLPIVTWNYSSIWEAFRLNCYAVTAFTVNAISVVIIVWVCVWCGFVALHINVTIEAHFHQLFNWKFSSLVESFTVKLFCYLVHIPTKQFYTVWKAIVVAWFINTVYHCQLLCCFENQYLLITCCRWRDKWNIFCKLNRCHLYREMEIMTFPI